MSKATDGASILVCVTEALEALKKSMNSGADKSNKDFHLWVNGKVLFDVTDTKALAQRKRSHEAYMDAVTDAVHANGYGVLRSAITPCKNDIGLVTVLFLLQS